MNKKHRFEAKATYLYATYTSLNATRLYEYINYSLFLQLHASRCLLYLLTFHHYH